MFSSCPTGVVRNNETVTEICSAFRRQIVVVTDQTQVRVGDCVTVEQAGTGTANVRRVSDALCEAAFSGQVDEELQAYMTQGADLCLQAKERLMEAETDEAFETAMRRVKFLCDD